MGEKQIEEFYEAKTKALDAAEAGDPIAEAKWEKVACEIQARIAQGESK